MATTWRGRSSSSSRPTYGGFSALSSQAAYGKWGKSSSTSRQSSAGKTKKSAGNWSSSAAYKGVSRSFECKINSYKTLYSQTQGPAKFDRPSPTVLNSFAKWIEKGAIVQTVAPAQVAKWAYANDLNFSTRNPSINSCKTVLSRKFGKSTIKAVCRAKNGYFLVATPSIWHGRPFHFPR